MYAPTGPKPSPCWPESNPWWWLGWRPSPNSRLFPSSASTPTTTACSSTTPRSATEPGYGSEPAKLIDAKSTNMVDAGQQLLARWTARLGLGEHVVTTKTLRRRFFSMAGRLTRSARRLTLHLPQRWPWENQFSRALAQLRALPLPS